MIRIRWYIGLGTDEDNKPLDVDKVERALDDIQSTISALYGGCTEYLTHGYWKDGATLVRERSTVIETICEERTSDGIWNNERARGMAQYIAKRLNQSEVLVTVEPITNVFHVTQEG
jgi:hypothetical protein